MYLNELDEHHRRELLRLPALHAGRCPGCQCYSLEWAKGAQGQRWQCLRKSCRLVVELGEAPLAHKESPHANQ